MENIELGLLLMVVGMVTVFVILLIVIWLSQLLISIVNKVAPGCGYIDSRKRSGNKSRKTAVIC